jgi:histidine triad (HIT) family protein
MADCIFCAIVAGDLPAEVIFRDEHTVAFMDISPATRGHCLVIPVEHAADIWELSPDQAHRVMATAHHLAGVIRERLQPDGLNLLQSNGEVAFQSVFHSHLHLIPRYADDGLRLPWTPEEGDREDIAAAAAVLRGDG